VSVLILPQRLNKQPQGVPRVNWGNQITRGIKRGAVLSAKRSRDALGTPVAFQGTVDEIVQGTGGPSLYATTPTDYHGFSFPLWTNTTGEASLVIRQRMESDSSIWLELGNSGAQDHFPYAGAVYSDAFWAGRWISGVAVPSWGVFNKDHIIVLTVKDGAQKAYWDGRLWHSNTLTGGFTVPASGSIGTVNGIVGTQSWGFGGWLYEYLLYDRVLAGAEARSLSENIHQVWVAPVRRLWAVSSGGTAYNQSVGGSITAAGALTKRTSKAVAGSSTASGAVAKRTSKPLSGSSTASGALTKRTSKAFAGSVTSTGNIVKRTSKAFAGSITGSGTLATMILFTASFAGSITPSGAIAKLTMKALAGTSTLAGAITKKTFKALDGNITMAGVLTKLTKKAMSGSVTAAGAVTTSYQVLKSLAGSITATGTVNAVYIAFVAGIRKLLALMGVGQ
jgi:hypothetical protein